MMRLILVHGLGKLFTIKKMNQIGPVNTHLISWPSIKHKTYKTWKIYGKEMTLTFNTHTPS